MGRLRMYGLVSLIGVPGPLEPEPEPEPESELDEDPDADPDVLKPDD
jgi:hypothetical protein